MDTRIAILLSVLCLGLAGVGYAVIMPTFGTTAPAEPSLGLYADHVNESEWDAASLNSITTARTLPPQFTVFERRLVTRTTYATANGTVRVSQNLTERDRVNLTAGTRARYRRDTVDDSRVYFYESATDYAWLSYTGRPAPTARADVYYNTSNRARYYHTYQGLNVTATAGGDQRVLRDVVGGLTVSTTGRSTHHGRPILTYTVTNVNTSAFHWLADNGSATASGTLHVGTEQGLIYMANLTISGEVADHYFYPANATTRTTTYQFTLTPYAGQVRGDWVDVAEQRAPPEPHARASATANLSATGTVAAVDITTDYLTPVTVSNLTLRLANGSTYPVTIHQPEWKFISGAYDIALNATGAHAVPRHDHDLDGQFDSPRTLHGTVDLRGATLVWTDTNKQRTLLVSHFPESAPGLSRTPPAYYYRGTVSRTATGAVVITPAVSKGFGTMAATYTTTNGTSETVTGIQTTTVLPDAAPNTTIRVHPNWNASQTYGTYTVGDTIHFGYEIGNWTPGSGVRVGDEE